MPLEQSNIKESTTTGIKKPKRYVVYIHNDDFTPMEFVVMILIEVFHHSEDKAVELMLRVHNSDKAPVGVYSYDIAMTKVNTATSMAREQGFPLRLSIKEK